MPTSPPVDTTTAPRHLPVFLDPHLLDPAPRSHDTQPPFLTPLYSLHLSLPLPLSLHSYLHAILAHLAHQATSPISFSPSTVTAALHHFVLHLSTRLWPSLFPRHRLSSILHPLVDCLAYATVTPHTPLGLQWVDEFAVAYTANAVSLALAARASASASPASPTVALSSAVSDVDRWLGEVRSTSLLPDPRDAHGASNLCLITRLLLAPLHSLHLLLLPCPPLNSPDSERSGSLWGAIADVFHASLSLSHAAGESTCMTAFQHCLSTVIGQWIFHSCTPPHLLPPSSPFPTAPASAPYVAALTRALPPHQVVTVLTDLVLMLFADDASTFPSTYLTLPTLPPSSSSARPSINGVASSCHRMHVVISAWGQPLSSLFDRLLQYDGSASSASVDAARVAPMLSFAASMIASGQSAMYCTALQSYLHQHMAAGSDLAVPLLSSISSLLYSPRMPLFEPTITACRRWKEQRERVPQPMSGVSGAVDGQLLRLVLDMAHTHRTITSLMGVASAEGAGTPSPPSPISSFTPSSTRATWLAVISFYAPSPAPCIRALTRRCRTASSHRIAWIDFLRSSLNASLFQSLLSLSTYTSASDPASPSSLLPSTSASPFHLLSSFLNLWMQLRLPGTDIIAAVLEPLPSSLSTLLPAVSTSSTYVSGAQLRAALTSYLHHPPAPTSSCGSLHSCAPPNIPALCSAVLTYFAALSSPFASCFTVISALSALLVALPLPVIATVVSRWLKRRLVELTSEDEVRRWSAGKGIALALLLVEELRMEWNDVWDAELSDEFIVQLLRYSSSVQTHHRRQPSTPLPPLPPLLSLIDFLLSTVPQARHWLPQVMRPSSSTLASSSTSALLRCSKLLQLLSAVFLSSPASPLSAQALMDSAATHPQWLELIQRWTERVRELQLTAAHSDDAVRCCCDLKERTVDDAEVRLAAALLSEQIAETEAESSADMPASKQTVRKMMRSNGHLVPQPAHPRRSGRLGHLSPDDAASPREEDTPDAVAHTEPNSRLLRSKANGVSGPKQQQARPTAPSRLHVRASLKPPIPPVPLLSHDDDAVVVQPSVDPLPLFLSAAPHSPFPLCRHSSLAEGWSCESSGLPPFSRWLRWVIVGSFASPMVVERCYAFIMTRFGELLSVDQLLSEAFVVGVQSVDRRRKAGLCPFLSPDLPPLLDRLLTNLVHQQTATPCPSPCLLHTLRSLLLTGTLLSSVVDVLRAVPRLQVIAWPLAEPSLSLLLRRLLPLVSESPFMVVWLLQCSALQWERRSKASRSSLHCVFQQLVDLWRGRHQEEATAALRETSKGFLQQLDTWWSQHSLPAGTPLRSSSVEPAQVEGVQSREEAEREDQEEPWGAAEGGGGGGQGFEVEWGRVCDDDLNLALSHKAERDRKGQRRAAPPQPLAVDVQPPPSAPQPFNLDSPLLTCEAQTQTEMDAPASPAPLAAVPAAVPAASASAAAAAVNDDSCPDLTSLLLPSFQPQSQSSPSSTSISIAVEDSARRCAEQTDRPDPFHLPDLHLLSPPPLHGFVHHFHTEQPSPPSPPPPPRPHRAPATASSPLSESVTSSGGVVASSFNPPLSPAIRSVTFTPMPRPHQQTASSPPPPPPPPSSSPQTSSPRPVSHGPAHSPAPLSFLPPPPSSSHSSASSSSCAPPALPFSHLRAASSITIKRSQTSTQAPLVVDVAAALRPEPPSDPDSSSSSFSLVASHYGLAPAHAPWLSGRVTQQPQLTIEANQPKRRRVT